MSNLHAIEPLEQSALRLLLEEMLDENRRSQTPRDPQDILRCLARRVSAYKSGKVPVDEVVTYFELLLHETPELLKG